MSEEINTAEIGSYAPPLDKLLTLGRPSETGVKDWLDYKELGIGPEHVSELVRMVGDHELYDMEEDESYGPIHAWRALGQLKAEAAVEPILGMLDEIIQNNDWALNEIHEVFGMIGPVAIPALTAILADTSKDEYARITASDSLVQLAKYYPESRETSIAIISRQLEISGTDEEESYINGYLVAHLLTLKAVEAAPLIERAYAADNVDKSITGDWEDAQVELGLLEARLTPKPRYNSFLDIEPNLASEKPMPFESGGYGGTSGSNKTQSQRKAVKAKRKIEKASRKKNRKRK